MKRIFQSFLTLFCFAMAAKAQNVVASYPFAGNAKDANGNNAAVHAAQLTADRFGLANSAFVFDGTQAFLEAPNSAALNSPNSTISFWVKPAALPVSGEGYIISNGGWQGRQKLSFPTHGKVVYTTHSGGVCCSDMDSGSPLTIGAWTHIVATHDGVNDALYVNGVLANTKAVAGGLDATTAPLGIGYDPIDKANFFNGAIDDVVFLDAALSGAQVAALYALQNTAPTIPQGLVASYSFTKNTLDGSGLGNHANATDGSQTTDRFGYGASAMGFNGSSSAVVAANSTALNSANTTISFWVKPNAYPVSGEVYLFSNGGWQDRLKISLPDHGKPVFTTHSGGVCCSDMDAGAPLAVGKWTHFVATHDGTNDIIYINGVQANSKAVAGALDATTRPLGIGFDPNDNNYFFDGSMDEVQVYNYALSAAEVATLNTAQSTFPGTNSNLVADYKLNGNTKDDSQFANNGSEYIGTDSNRHGWAGNAMANPMTAANSPALQSDYTTINFWVKPYALPVTGEVFLLSNGGWQERWKISLPDHGKPVFTTHSGGACCSDLDSGTPLAIGVWKMVTMVHDGTNDIIYFDGVKVNEKAAPGALDKTKYPFALGYDPIDNGGAFNGAMDDVQIYNKALDAAEIAALFAAQNATPVVAGTLVAEYKFSGNGEDATAYQNHSYPFATLAKDRFGKTNHAYAMDGVGEGVYAENSPQQNTNFTTISFWINPVAFPVTGEDYIMSNGGWQERWKISLPDHGKPVFTTHSGGACCSDLDSGTPLVKNAWTHVAMTHDGAKDIIYFNGVKVNEKASTGNLDPTIKPLGIGYDPIDNNYFFNGSLDDVQIYNEALDAAAIAALYAAQNTPPVSTDTEAPDAPLNLKADVVNTSIDLSWVAASDNVGVVAYNIYQDGANIGTTSFTSAFMYGLSPLTLYHFGVSAVDAEGNESLISYLDATSGVDAAPDTEAPTVPTNLQAATGSNSILFSWDASTDNTLVAGYVVSLDGVFYDSVPGNQLSVFIGGLQASTPYSLDVYAFDLAGNNSATASIDVTTDVAIVTAEAGMVAYYPFEGNANDATPYLNHGAIGGNPTFITADHPNGGAQAIKFDGQMDSVLVPNAVQLISDYTTVSFWIRVDEINLADAESYILDFGHWDERWKISLPQHLKIVWTTNSHNANFPELISDMDSGGGNEVVKGFWWQVTMVHENLADKIYVNGVLAGSKTILGNQLNVTARPLGIGSNPVEGGQYFNGALDELKIYNKSLTDAEVLHLFQTGTTATGEIGSNGLKGLVKEVFPVPATEELFVDHAFDGKEPLQLRVFDVAGRQLDDVRFEKNGIPAGQFSVKTGSLPQGTYFLNFVLGGKNIGSVKFDKK